MTTEKWLEWNKKYLMTAIGVVGAELSDYFQRTKGGKESGTSIYPTAVQAREDMERLEENIPVVPALSTLADAFQLSSFEKKILLMCAGVELDSGFAGLLSAIQESDRKLPSFSLGLSAFADAHWSALTPDGPLRYWNLIELTKNDLPTRSACSINEYILHYLAGINQLDHRLSPYVKPVLAGGNLSPTHLRASEELTNRLSGFTQTGIYPLIQVLGTNMEDIAAVVANAFSTYGLTVFRLPAWHLPSNLNELTEFVRLWNRSALLNPYVLFLHDVPAGIPDQPTSQYLAYLTDHSAGIVVIGSRQKIHGLGKTSLTMEVPRPTREEQEKLWSMQLGPISPSIDGLPGEIASQFDLDAYDIKILASSVAAGYQAKDSVIGKESTRQLLWKACCDYTRPDLDMLARRIDPLATWDDLVLPDMQKAILKEIAIHVRQRNKVYYEWGFAGKSNRGLGISVLFSGDSGTGKTMASEVLANELNLDLYRIDLSQVVNKYIGETEKNLKKVFDAAEGSGAILLFDEADALFGKRSEVKDSHDRYSNIEVSYLLQKMEEYRGLAILTTNMKAALDRAFLRRIRFIVQFPFPDALMRADIWKRIFPERTPVDGLDIQKLSTFNVAGGNIRNIALNASFLAAEKNKPVSMHYILLAARHEYQKLEKQMSAYESIR